MDKVWKLEVSSSEQSEFQREALQIHNQYRAHHHVLPLMTSKELTKQAEKWAKHLAENDLFEHSTSDDIGENVAMHYSSLTTAYSGMVYRLRALNRLSGLNLAREKFSSSPQNKKAPNIFTIMGYANH